MPVDTSIYQNLLAPPKSVNDYDNANALAASNQLKLKSQQQAYDEATQVAGEKNALRQALSQGLDPTTPEGRIGLYKVAPTMAPGILKTMQDQITSQAVANKDNAQAKGYVVDQNIKMHDFQLQKLARVADPGQMQSWIVDSQKSGVMDMNEASAAMQALQQASQMPGGFDKLKTTFLQSGQTAQQQMQQRQAREIADQSNATSIANNEATNKTHIITTGMSNATSRANNRDTISSENLRAGMVPGGGMDDNSERTAQAIASGQLPAPTGMALLNPKNQRILGRVMEINPQYDSTTVTAKKKAASDFTTGALGNSMRSFAVAGQHLDQLNTLVDALDNGNMQIVNKIGNAYATQTGNPAPTNFDAAKDVVSKEVVKAIVAGGGGVSERQELAGLLSQAKSPAQLKGVIQQYRNLMAAQHDALLTQRRAAGLPDSTLPNYKDANGSPDSTVDLPPEISAILKKHGK